MYRNPGSFSPALVDFYEGAESLGYQHGMDWQRLFDATVMQGSDGARHLALLRGAKVMGAMSANVDPGLQHLGVAVGALGNYYSAEYKPAVPHLASGVDLAPLIRTLRRESMAQPELRFAPMDPQAPEYAALRVALQTAGYAVFQYFCHGNWFLPAGQRWDGYLEQRPGELRSTIKRMQKRLLADGARIEISSGVDDVDRALAAYEQVYSRSWKQPEPVPQFMPELIRLCARRGWLRLGIVWLADVPIAAQVWIVAHGRAAIFKLAFDEAYKRYAAGTVLTAHLMQHVLDVDKVHEVDYLIGDDAYKRQWMTHRRERWGLVAYDLHTLRGSWGALRQWLTEKLRQRRTPLPTSN